MKDKNEKTKIFVSSIIPRDGSGTLLRNIIFSYSDVKWEKVEELIKNLYPEHKCKR